jgi:hypothetical protein
MLKPADHPLIKCFVSLLSCMYNFLLKHSQVICLTIVQLSTPSRMFTEISGRSCCQPKSDRLLTCCYLVEVFPSCNDSDVSNPNTNAFNNTCCVLWPPGWALWNHPDSVPPSLKQGLTDAHCKLSDYYYKIDTSPYYLWSSRECYKLSCAIYMYL